MSLVTLPAPDFTADAVYPDDEIKSLTLSKHKGHYVLLFFYPSDFTFVCPSEIIAFHRKIEEFRKRNCELIGISVDSAYSHYAWRQTELKRGGIGRISYPLVADITKSIARSYGVLINGAVALRGQFLIDAQGIVQHELVNNLSLGRNVFEALRILDALQFTEKHGEVCPANWNPGDKTMKASPEGVAEYLERFQCSK